MRPLLRTKTFHGMLTPKVLTSSWSSGAPGPIGFCVSEGAMSSEQLHEFNLKNKGIAYCLTSGTRSHFMCGETYAVMLEQLYSVAFANQRIALGLPPNALGALLCDAWTGTFSKNRGLHLRRQYRRTHHWFKCARLTPPKRL